MSWQSLLGGAVSASGTISNHLLRGLTGGLVGMPEFGLSEAITDPTRPFYSANPNNLSKGPGSAGIAATGVQTKDTASDPGFNPGDGNVGGSGYGGGSAASNAAYWNDQLNALDSQLGRLDTQGNIGRSNIEQGYNSAFNTLTNQKTQNQEDYNTNRTHTIQDNVKAKGAIDEGVHNQLTGLTRLLGSRGAGNSSAALVAAPYAAGLQGNQQRQEVQDTFGRNIGSLDTNWDRTLKGFDSAFGQLLADKANKERALQAGLDATRQQLLGQKQQVRSSLGLAPDAGISNRIRDLGSQIDQLGAQQVFTPQTVAYKTPDLAAYTYNPASAPVLGAGVDPGQAANVGPYYTLLGGDNKDKKTGLIPAAA